MGCRRFDETLDTAHACMTRFDGGEQRLAGFSLNRILALSIGTHSVRFPARIGYR